MYDIHLKLPEYINKDVKALETWRKKAVRTQVEGQIEIALSANAKFTIVSDVSRYISGHTPNSFEKEDMEEMYFKIIGVTVEKIENPKTTTRKTAMVEERERLEAEIAERQARIDEINKTPNLPKKTAVRAVRAVGNPLLKFGKAKNQKKTPANSQPAIVKQDSSRLSSQDVLDDALLDSTLSDSNCSADEEELNELINTPLRKRKRT